MEFVSRLPRQTHTPEPKQSLSKNKSKKAKEKKSHKEKGETLERKARPQVDTRTIQDNFVLRASSAHVLPSDILDLTEDDLFTEWGQMRKWVNGELAQSLISQRYSEIEMNLAQLKTLKHSVARDSKVSLYKFGIAEDQGTSLNFEDFLYYGIPRVQSYGIPEEKDDAAVLNSNSEMYLRI